MSPHERCFGAFLMNSWNLGEGPRGGRCTESVRIGPNLEMHDFAANSLKPVVTDMNFMKLFSVLHLVHCKNSHRDRTMKGGIQRDEWL